MDECVEFALIRIEGMTCKVHGKTVFNGLILEGTNISFSTCCPEFAQEVNDTVYNAINDYHGVSYLNQKVRRAGE